MSCSTLKANAICNPSIRVSYSNLLTDSEYILHCISKISAIWVLELEPNSLVLLSCRPSTYNTHARFVSNSCALILGFIAVNKVFSTSKSAKACTYTVRRDWKSILYSLNSNTHFVILPVRLGLCITFQRGTIVSTGCAWKYDLSFCAITT